MAVKPKIFGGLVDVLRDAYVVKRMSTTDIEKNSVELFGTKISCGTIYKEIIRHNIPIRSKSESVSMATCTLDRDLTWMNSDMVEWVDGFILGDGAISMSNKETFMGSRFGIETSQIEWAKYSTCKLSPYQPSDPIPYRKIDDKHPNQLYQVKTLTHPDIINQAKRWYQNGFKKVPKDVVISPISIMLWYLGDGSLTVVEESNTAFIRFATCSFLVDDIENILMPKFRDIGFECVRDSSKNDIRLSASSIVKFFNYIGHKSPIECYDYKFEYPEWLNLIRLSDIVNDDKEKWRAQYYCKTGSVGYSKSPGGAFFLFTESQAKELRKKLDS